MHPDAHLFVSRAVAGHVPFRRVIECGGRNINGSVRSLFVGREYVSVDVEPGPDVDVVADFTTLDLPPGDAVVCCEVLEHVPDPRAVLAAAHRHLELGGLLVLTCAGPGREPHSGIDGGPLRPGEHYANIDPVDLFDWLGALFSTCDVTVNERAHDVYATALA